MMVYRVGDVLIKIHNSPHTENILASLKDGRMCRAAQGRKKKENI